MMQTVRRAMRDRARGDEGVGLILVIGVSVFVLLLAAVAVSFAVNGVTQSRNRTNFEKALATAEAGIDYGLSKVQASFAGLGADYPIPASTTALDAVPDCQGTPISFPATAPTGQFASEDAERTWARSVLESLVGVSQCVHQGDDGEYVVFKPPAVAGNAKYGRVYSLAALPSFDDPQETRLVKNEYIFMPFRPQFAILSGGDLEISSSTTVTAVAGADPSLAQVHANGVVTVPNGNPTVYGEVTSTDTSTATSNKFYGNSGGAVASKPSQALPFISAAGLYNQAADVDPTALVDWYDLCSDGTARPYSTSGPCTGTVIATATSSSTKFRGWYYNAPSRTWIATSSIQSGTYYVSEANVDNANGNTSVDRLTIIASAANPTSCSAKQYGNITWDHYEMRHAAFGSNWLYADSDLVTTSNFAAGSTTAPVSSGYFVAGDQASLQTSSQGAAGAVMIGDQCQSPAPSGLITENVVKNPSVFYDPNAAANFTSVVTTALWLDYSGG